MARRPAETPAPEGFWDEARGYHDQLWRATESQHRRTLLRTRTADVWMRHDPEDPRLAIGTKWRASRFIGGIVFGTVNITRMRLAGAEAVTTLETVEAPLENTYLTYVLPKPDDDKHKPQLSVSKKMYTPGELNLPQGPVFSRVELFEMWSRQNQPDIQDYALALAELAAGASGMYRQPPQP